MGSNTAARMEKARMNISTNVTKKVKDLDVATKVSVSLQLTDPNIRTRDKIVKKTEKDSLYSAIDVAAVWLERSLATR